MKFKVGDRVRIREDLEIGKLYGKDIFVEKMACMRGRIATITTVFYDGKKFRIKECGYEWTPEMVEVIPKDKLIFRDNATILIKDGKRYVTKCDKDDVYDREKGLLIVLAKANGIKYADIQKILENAEIQGRDMKAREVSRPAKVGEYIKVIFPITSGSAYSKGDIGKVLKREDDGVFVKTKGTYPTNIGGNTSYLFDEEYVVLENYKPKTKESE